MCTNGVNASQLQGDIEMVDEAIALSRRWTHRCFHAADDAGQKKTAAKLKEAQGLLDEVRALLDEAKDLVDSEAADGVVVELA